MSYTQSAQAQRVWLALQQGDITTAEISARAFVSPRSLEGILREFRACGLVHVCAWIQPPESRYHQVALYRFGAGEHQPRPKRGISNNTVYVETSMAAHRVVESLQQSGPLSMYAIAESVGIAPGYAHRILRVLLKTGGIIHVSDWIRIGRCGQASSVYAAGPGKDKARPRAQKQATISRRRRQRLAAQFGPDIANRIQTSRRLGGPERIVVDGITVFERAKDRRSLSA